MSSPATRPWRVLWAMLVGVFMTLIDWTAVSVYSCMTKPLNNFHC
jgi:hypothetical protein